MSKRKEDLRIKLNEIRIERKKLESALRRSGVINVEKTLQQLTNPPMVHVWRYVENEVGKARCESSYRGSYNGYHGGYYKTRRNHLDDVYGPNFEDFSDLRSNEYRQPRQRYKPHLYSNNDYYCPRGSPYGRYSRGRGSRGSYGYKGKQRKTDTMHSNKPPCNIATAATPELKYVEDDACFDDDSQSKNSVSAPESSATEIENVDIKTEEIDSDAETVCFDLADLDIETEVSTETVSPITLSDIDTKKSYLVQNNNQGDLSGTGTSLLLKDISVVSETDTVTSSVDNSVKKTNCAEGYSSVDERECKTPPPRTVVSDSTVAATEEKLTVIAATEEKFTAVTVTPKEESTAAVATPEAKSTVAAEEKSTPSTNKEATAAVPEEKSTVAAEVKSTAFAIEESTVTVPEEKSAVAAEEKLTPVAKENKSAAVPPEEKSTAAAIEEKSAPPSGSSSNNAHSEITPTSQEVREAQSKSIMSSCNTTAASNKKSPAAAIGEKSAPPSIRSSSNAHSDTPTSHIRKIQSKSVISSCNTTAASNKKPPAAAIREKSAPPSTSSSSNAHNAENTPTSQIRKLQNKSVISTCNTTAAPKEKSPATAIGEKSAPQSSSSSNNAHSEATKHGENTSTSQIRIIRSKSVISTCNTTAAPKEKSPAAALGEKSAPQSSSSSSNAHSEAKHSENTPTSQIRIIRSKSVVSNCNITPASNKKSPAAAIGDKSALPSSNAQSEAKHSENTPTSHIRKVQSKSVISTCKTTAAPKENSPAAAIEEKSAPPSSNLSSNAHSEAKPNENTPTIQIKKAQSKSVISSSSTIAAPKEKSPLAVIQEKFAQPSSRFSNAHIEAKLNENTSTNQIRKAQSKSMISSCNTSAAPKEKSSAAVTEEKSAQPSSKFSSNAHSEAKPNANTPTNQIKKAQSKSIISSCNTSAAQKEKSPAAVIEKSAQPSSRFSSNAHIEVKPNENTPTNQVRKAQSKSVTSSCNTTAAPKEKSPAAVIEEKSAQPPSRFSSNAHSEAKPNENTKPSQKCAVPEEKSPMEEKSTSVSSSASSNTQSEVKCSENTKKCQVRKSRSKSVASERCILAELEENSPVSDNTPKKCQARKARSKSVDINRLLQIPGRITRSKSFQFGLWGELPDNYKELPSTPKKRRKSFCAGMKSTADEEEKVKTPEKNPKENRIDFLRRGMDQLRPIFNDTTKYLIKDVLKKFANKKETGHVPSSGHEVSSTDTQKNEAKSAVQEAILQSAKIAHRRFSSAFPESTLKKDTDNTSTASKIDKRRASASASKAANETQPVRIPTDPRTYRPKDDERQKRRKSFEEERNKKLKTQEPETPTKNAPTNRKNVSMVENTLVRFGDFKRTHKFSPEGKKNKEIFQNISMDEMEEPTFNQKPKIVTHKKELFNNRKLSLDTKELAVNHKEVVQKSEKKLPSSHKENLHKLPSDKNELSSNHKEKTPKLSTDEKKSLNHKEKFQKCLNPKEVVQKTSMDEKKPLNQKETLQLSVDEKKSLNTNQNIQKLPKDENKLLNQKEKAQKLSMGDKKTLNFKEGNRKSSVDEKKSVNQKAKSQKLYADNKKSLNLKENVQKSTNTKKSLNAKENVQKPSNEKKPLNQKENIQKPSSDEKELSSNQKEMLKKLFGEEDSPEERQKNKRKREPESGIKKRRESATAPKERQPSPSSKSDVSTAYNELVQELFKLDEAEQDACITLHADDMRSAVLVKENKCLPIHVASVGTVEETPQCAAHELTDFRPNAARAVERVQPVSETFVAVEAARPRREASHKVDSPSAEANKSSSTVEFHQLFAKALGDAIVQAQTSLKGGSNNDGASVVTIQENEPIDKSNPQKNTNPPVTETNDKTKAISMLAEAVENLTKELTNPPTASEPRASSSSEPVKTREQNKPDMNPPNTIENRSNETDPVDDIVRNVLYLKRVNNVYTVEPNSAKSSENPVKPKRKRGNAGQPTSSDNLLKQLLLDEKEKEKAYWREKQRQSEINQCVSAVMQQPRPGTAVSDLPNAGVRQEGGKSATTASVRPPKVPRIYVAAEFQEANLNKRLAEENNAPATNVSPDTTSNVQPQNKHPENTYQQNHLSYVKPGSSTSKANASASTKVGRKASKANKPPPQSGRITVDQFVELITPPMAFMLVQTMNNKVIMHNFRTYFNKDFATASVMNYNVYFTSELRRVAVQIAANLDGFSAFVDFSMKHMLDMLAKELQKHYRLQVDESQLFKTFAFTFKEVYTVTKSKLWKDFYKQLDDVILKSAPGRLQELQRQNAMQTTENRAPPPVASVHQLQQQAAQHIQNPAQNQSHNPHVAQPIHTNSAYPQQMPKMPPPNVTISRNSIPVPHIPSPQTPASIPTPTLINRNIQTHNQQQGAVPNVTLSRNPTPGRQVPSPQTPANVQTPAPAHRNIQTYNQQQSAVLQRQNSENGRRINILQYDVVPPPAGQNTNVSSLNASGNLPNASSVNANASKVAENMSNLNNPNVYDSRQNVAGAGQNMPQNRNVSIWMPSVPNMIPDLPKMNPIGQNFQQSMINVEQNVSNFNQNQSSVNASQMVPNMNQILSNIRQNISNMTQNTSNFNNLSNVNPNVTNLDPNMSNMTQIQSNLQQRNMSTGSHIMSNPYAQQQANPPMAYNMPQYMSQFNPNVPNLNNQSILRAKMSNTIPQALNANQQSMSNMGPYMPRNLSQQLQNLSNMNSQNVPGVASNMPLSYPAHMLARNANFSSAINAGSNTNRNAYGMAPNPSNLSSQLSNTSLNVSNISELPSKSSTQSPASQISANPNTPMSNASLNTSPMAGNMSISRRYYNPDAQRCNGSCCADDPYTQWRQYASAAYASDPRLVPAQLYQNPQSFVAEMVPPAEQPIYIFDQSDGSCRPLEAYNVPQPGQQAAIAETPAAVAVMPAAVAEMPTRPVEMSVANDAGATVAGNAAQNDQAAVAETAPEMEIAQNSLKAIDAEVEDEKKDIKDVKIECIEIIDDGDEVYELDDVIFVSEGHLDAEPDVKSEIEDVKVEKEKESQEEEQVIIENDTDVEMVEVARNTSSIDSGINSPNFQYMHPAFYENRVCICKEEAVEICTCGKAIYCSRYCQIEDWPNHKAICNNNDG